MPPTKEQLRWAARREFENAYEHAIEDLGEWPKHEAVTITLGPVFARAVKAETIDRLPRWYEDDGDDGWED